MPEVQRGSCRFVAGITPDGKPGLQLKVFHSTVPFLSSYETGFEILGGH